ncbi:OprO/OprP family phosphate-selective porin [Salinibacter grassmerensis]|uniref:OprO/OprP family phosphate-selective porin n=1 Tax=Salinibacter grassmerensis TaxID=3040353 RepID=UPI0021E77174|nr:OprO/OprP family phosphate-selective porin [Salinibacter grassmerensis]
MTSFATVLRRSALGLAALLIGLGAHPAAAQSPGGAGVTVGAGDALRVGGLVQADAYLGREAGPNDGFRARSARLRLGGQAEGLSYVVQTDFTSSSREAPSSLLDAFVQVPLANRLRLRGGLFKTPYSAEFLAPRPRIRFAERARVVNALAPNRQAGVQLTGDLTAEASDAQVTATLGAFNGTRGLSTNDNENLLYLGRLTGSAPLGPGTLDVGASGGYSIDGQVSIPNTLPNTVSTFTGTRALFQADAQYETDRWLLAGALHAADLEYDDEDPATGINSQSPFGYYATAGLNVADGHQVLARLEGYDPDSAGRTPDDQFVLGYNYDASSVLRVVVNYKASTEDVADGFFTGRLQVAF